ncbi:hypothetical protein AY599_19195 [Leptolyngbya valderiana BDU 20041]|nr:hypothetical protein AY599_19195 [Leptolyngbya valderiana BDU 20041]
MPKAEGFFYELEMHPFNSTNSTTSQHPSRLDVVMSQLGAVLVSIRETHESDFVRIFTSV